MYIPDMLIPEFGGGLGNHMFQMGAVYSFAKQSGHTFGIQRYKMAPAMHSFINYGATIFKNTHMYLTQHPPTVIYLEERGTYPYIEQLRTIPDSKVVCMQGYWQRSAILEPYRDEIVNLFHFNTDILSAPKYEEINNAYFLHVRRGDYVNDPQYSMDLTHYYTTAISKYPSGSIAYILSNDLPWCRDWSVLDDVRHTFIEENDVDSLSVMKHCAHGGIAVNSTFSWWGLYLNTARPTLCLPSIWNPNRANYTENCLSFPEATIVQVNQ
jgi:hypothetical protein